MERLNNEVNDVHINMDATQTEMIPSRVSDNFEKMEDLNLQKAITRYMHYMLLSDVARMTLCMGEPSRAKLVYNIEALVADGTLERHGLSKMETPNYSSEEDLDFRVYELNRGPPLMDVLKYCCMKVRDYFRFLQ